MCDTVDVIGAGGVDRAAGGRDTDTGGGGGVGRGVDAFTGVRGAADDGGGGADEGSVADEFGGGGPAPEGFRYVMGGGGGFTPVGGGGGILGGRSEFERNEASEFGLGAGFGGGFFRLVNKPFEGCGGDDIVDCGLGLRALSRDAFWGFDVRGFGGFGGEILEISGSEVYDDS